ncbi:ubiquitin C-terminal hydrolase 13-like [Prosopis cineraria]|uniref:ubiquitin C-terminal hydrolase 13-like n=1 Tax=Prosopis cineraria TaxID=364024 RepID=UPI00240FABD6|nr:ubiquitin C-terminal hydrolase 13-like [Prosopis cineraria]XP_054776316.1 ubiquitin C-terminal hydrolase 13-like [Prosopis cineraria]
MRIRKCLADSEMRQNKGSAKKRKEMSGEDINIEDPYLTSEITICNRMMLYHREQRPTHYTLQIKSYSALASSKIERYESSVFEAGDYKWRLILYLHGNSEVNKDGHISLYLGIPEAQIAELPFGWEVWAHFKFLVLDQINDKYLVIQGIAFLLS